MEQREPEPMRRRINQTIARELGTAILTGKYKPGEGLGGEVEKSETLKVSRSAYREAVRILIAKGLIETRPKAGTIVTPRHRWNLLDPDILAWMFTAEPDERFTHDLFELRGIIEPAAAELAAERRSPAQLEIMRAALDSMDRVGLSGQEGQAADRRFHRTILEATGNEALLSLSGSIGAAVQWTTHFKQRIHLAPRDPLPEHRAVFEAISAGDRPRARAAMMELLGLALADMATGP